MNQHTPGPWEVSKIGNPYQQFMVYDSDGRNICNTVEGEANARLIAAAPELYDACKLALALIKDHWPYEHGNPQVGDAWGALETAIAEAEGRTP